MASVTAKSKGRVAGIIAARDLFYKGDIAREMVAFLQKHGAPFVHADFAEFFARIEEPARTTYRGYTVYKHGFGSQSPVLLQALNILENFDLCAMGYGSADYLHTVTEAMKLAYAYRNTYYADPAFVTSPGEGLLSKVSEPPRRSRAAARSNAALLRFVLAAHGRLQPAERRSRDPRRRLQRTTDAWAQRQPPAVFRNVGMRHRRHDRSCDTESFRRRRSAPRLLRDRVLAGYRSAII